MNPSMEMQEVQIGFAVRLPAMALPYGPISYRLAFESLVGRICDNWKGAALPCAGLPVASRDSFLLEHRATPLPLQQRRLRPGVVWAQA